MDTITAPETAGAAAVAVEEVGPPVAGGGGGVGAAELEKGTEGCKLCAARERKALEADSRFECNICLDSANDAVVTRCGHLFCWTCLFRWLSTNHTECPVCKAGVTKENVIPLYGKDSDNVDPRTKLEGEQGEGGARERIPDRPTADRPQAARPQQQQQQGLDGNAFVQFSAGFGFFPSLFGLQFQNFTHSRSSAPPPAVGEPPSPEEAQQAFLSHLLLGLGSFVILCLLLF